MTAPRPDPDAVQRDLTAYRQALAHGDQDTANKAARRLAAHVPELLAEIERMEDETARLMFEAGQFTSQVMRDLEDRQNKQ